MLSRNNAQRFRVFGALQFRKSISIGVFLSWYLLYGESIELRESFLDFAQGSLHLEASSLVFTRDLIHHQQRVTENVNNFGLDAFCEPSFCEQGLIICFVVCKSKLKLYGAVKFVPFR